MKSIDYIGQRPNKKNIDTKSKSFKFDVEIILLFGRSNIIFNDCLEKKKGSSNIVQIAYKNCNKIDNILQYWFCGNCIKIFAVN